MKLLRFSFLPAILSLLPLAHADSAPPSAPPAAAKSDPTLSLDFPGGSLGDLIAMVEKMSGDTALNVIGEKAALATEVQAFTVRNADRDTLLTAIGELLRTKGVRLAPVGRGVFIASLEPKRDRPPAPRMKNEAEFDSFQLSGIIDPKLSVDNIVDAVRAAWTLDPSHDANALQIKFHPPTQLLLVSGPREAIEMTREVIRSLHDTRRPHPELSDALDSLRNR